MMRAIILSLMFALGVAEPALACKPQAPRPSLPGESPMQTTLRYERLDQMKRWDAADSVVLASVVAVRETKHRKFTTFETIAAIRGVSPGRFRLDRDEASCRPLPALRVGETVVVYRAKKTRSGDPVGRDDWVTTDVRSPKSVLDPRVVAALRQAAARLRADS